MRELVGGRQAHGILPAGVRVLVDALDVALPADIQVDILLKMPDGDNRPIVFDFHGLVCHCGDIVGAFQEQREHIRCQIIPWESEPGVIRAEADAGIWLDFGLGDHGRHNLGQIIPELLDVFQAADMIDGFHAPPDRPDKDELEPEPVLPADDFLLLVFVVVGRCAKMAENHLRNPEFVFGMLGDVDSITVIRHMNRSIGRIDFHFESRHGERIGLSIGDGLCLTDNMVAHIHHPFVEKLV